VAGDAEVSGDANGSVMDQEADNDTLMSHCMAAALQPAHCVVLLGCESML